MASLLSWGNAKRLWDQVNPFDNGRTWEQRTPVPSKQGSVIHQATHNGATNAVGNTIVKPVYNTVQTATEVPRFIVSAATNNDAARNASALRLNTEFKQSIPGWFTQQGIDSVKGFGDLAFRAPITDLMGNTAEAQRIRAEGGRAFNNTVFGSAVRPIEVGIANAFHANKQQQADIGLNPDATGAQKYFADPLMGAAAIYGISKAGGGLPKTKAAIAQDATGAITDTPKVTKIPVKDIPTDTPKSNAAINSNIAKLQDEYGKEMRVAELRARTQPSNGLSVDQNVANAQAEVTAKYDQIFNGLTKRDQAGNLPVQIDVKSAPDIPAPTPDPKILNAKIKNVKDPVRKEQLIAERDATQPTAKQAPLNLPDPGVFTGAAKEPGKVARAWQSVNGVLSQYGTAGKELVNRLKLARDNSEIGQQAFLDRIPTVQKLNKNEMVDFVSALERRSNGEQVAVSPKVTQAIGEWNKAIPLIRNTALKYGLDVGDLGPNYFPRIYKDLQHGKNLDKMAQQLVDTGKAKNLGEAHQQLQYMRQQYISKYGNLEHSRKLDLPGYEMTHDALTTYIANAFDRITKAQQFGGKNEILNQIKDQAAKEGYNIANGSHFDKSLRIALGDVDHSGTGYKVSSGVRKFNALRSLGTAGVSNATQLTNTATIAGVGRTVKGVYKFATDATARRQAHETGVLLDHSLNTLAQQGLGTSGAITKNLASPFFSTVERFNRQATAIVGKDWGNKLAKQGKHDILREKLGVTGPIGDTLTRKQEIQVSRALVEKAQFKVDPMDIPGWTDSWLGKMGAQFRTFGYKQTDFMWNQVLREATKGNFLPLTRFVAVGAPAGVAALTVKGALKRAPLIDSNNNNAQKALAGISQVGGFGIPGSIANDVANGIKYGDLPGSLAGTVGGPTASFAVETSNNLKKAQAGDPTKLEKQGLRSIPAVGPAIANTVFPKKKDNPVTPQNKDQATVAEIQAQDKKEVAKFKDKAKRGGTAIQQLTSGNYVYQVGDKVETTEDKAKAQKAIDKYNFDKSGKEDAVIGDRFWYRDQNNDVKSKYKFEHEFDVADSQNQLDMKVAKDDENYAGWKDSATKQIDALTKLRDHYKQHAQEDKVDDTQKKIETLQHQMETYDSYGGAFKKGKSYGSGGSSSGGFSLSGISQSSTSHVKTPSGVAVRAPAAPNFKTTGLKKQTVTKASSNYLSKKLR